MDVLLVEIGLGCNASALLHAPNANRSICTETGEILIIGGELNMSNASLVTH